MNDRKRRKRGDKAKTAVRRGVATGGTVTFATLGLTNCNNGGGTSVDPPPPPPLVCADADQGQNLVGFGAVQDSTLTVNLFSSEPVGVDTVFVSNVVGARLDSLQGGLPIRLAFTLDADTTSQVAFTLSGTFDLAAGPCGFTRTFNVMIGNGNVQVTRREDKLPLGQGRDVRIELVRRDGFHLHLKAAGAVSGSPRWNVTAGTIQRSNETTIVWRLPSRPGFYQVELIVEDEDSFGFDALSFEVG